MRLLVTNDDGINSPGIHALVRALSDHTDHDIVVVAPDRDWSGAGACIGSLGPTNKLAVQRVEIPGAESVEAYGLEGPPGLTVVAGCLGAFGEPPDIVVSGVNAGLNTGRSILHSGTVGAALTAQNFGRSGLAVSVQPPAARQDDDAWRWDTAARLAVEVLDRVVDAPSRSVLNLNVPSLPYDDVAGVRWARLAAFGEVRSAITDRGPEHLQFELHPTDEEPDPDTDTGTVRAGYAAITTLVGIVEAWPAADAAAEPPPEVVEALVPGAPLHPVHRLPDASARGTLHRPMAAPA